MSEPRPLVEVEGLRVETASGLPIVEDVSFSLEAGEALGVVGETGSGKTTSVLAMLGYSQPGSTITDGHVRVGDSQMTTASGRDQRKLRGKVVSYVPQNPAGSLNPSMRIGDAIVEMLKAHQVHGDAAPPVAGALERVGLQGDDEFQRRFPHQLSGGQQQRVCIRSRSSASRRWWSWTSRRPVSTLSLRRSCSTSLSGCGGRQVCQ